MPFNILSLDGGGSLGVYTLGILIEVRKMLGVPLHDVFHLVYGTSTGSIIATLLALEHDVDDVQDIYFSTVKDVMGRIGRRAKSKALYRNARSIYGNRKFRDLGVQVGVVATNLEYNTPMVFKTDVGQAHGSRGSFEPGFGCLIADAVAASCAAVPFFSARIVETPNHGSREVIDGGFVANNPTLFALTDALGPLRVPMEDIRVLSLGTGHYPKRELLRQRLLRKVSSYSHTASTFMALPETSSNSMETMRRLLFKDIHTVRVDESFTDARYRTNFLESDPKLLEKIFQLGRESYGKHEQNIMQLLQTPPSRPAEPRNSFSR